MGTTLASQIMIFLFSFVLGSFLGLIFDIFKVVNSILEKNLKRVFFEDILYFILSAFATFIYVLIVNMGEIRFYILSGEIIGWLIYRFTFGRLIYKFILIITRFLYNWISRFKKYIISKLPKNRVKKLFKKIKSILHRSTKELKLKKVIFHLYPKNNKQSKIK